MKVLQSQEPQEIQRMAEENAPRHVVVTHYHPIIHTFGESYEICINYLRKKGSF